MTDIKIYYSCLICGDKFLHIDKVENHIEEVHERYNPEEIEQNYLIHFP